MEEMWASRSKPTPLEFEVARASASGSGTMATEGDKEAARKHKTSLKDQRQLSLAENVELFARR